MVSFVYAAGPRLPETDTAGIGALLTQFRGELERPLIEKGLRHDGGEAGARTRLEAVSVNGQPGFWLEGAPHSFFLVCAEREQCREERYRLAGNVLLWERGELTLRLESALSRDEALAIAATVQTPQ